MNIIKMITITAVIVGVLAGCKKLTLENSYTFSQVAGGSHTSSFDHGVDTGPYLDFPRADAYWQGRVEHYHLARKFNTPMTFRINYTTRQASTYNPSNCVTDRSEFCELGQGIEGGYELGLVLSFSPSGVIYDGAILSFSPDGGQAQASQIVGKIGTDGMAGAFHGTGISGGFFARP